MNGLNKALRIYYKINSHRHYHLRKDLVQRIPQAKNTQLDYIKSTKNNYYNQMKVVKYKTIKVRNL
jgi:hypothetical protein